MHNKFLVLTEKNKPTAVLFGSTNLTENGIYGHANCTHVVENAAIAGKYLAYLREAQDAIRTRPGGAQSLQAVDDQADAAPAKSFDDGMAPVSRRVRISTR